MFFPISLIVTFFTLGKLKTKQFLLALMNDFFSNRFNFSFIFVFSYLVDLLSYVTFF